MFLKPGVLILDEPTNHINFRHIPIIAEALDAFEGGMILVSHVDEFVWQIRMDQYLVSKIHESKKTSFTCLYCGVSR